MAKKNGNGTEEPLEKQLWKTADKLRKKIDVAEYKHIAGFCASTPISRVAELYYVLTPGR